MPRATALPVRSLARAATLLGLALALPGCGDKDGDSGAGGGAASCTDYFSAFAACVDEFGGDPAAYGITGNNCADYPPGNALETAHACYAGVLAAADCSTEEGYGAAVEQMSAECG